MIDSIIAGLATAIIIAFFATVWHQLLRDPILSYLHGLQDIRGTWRADWDAGAEVLVIRKQAGKWISGTRTLYFKPTKYYTIRGVLVGNTLVAYCIPAKQDDNIAGTIILQIIETGNKMKGKSTGLEPRHDNVFSADNEWIRNSK